MKADVFGRRARGAVGLVAAALLAGCEPGAEGGFDRVAYRSEPQVPRVAFPDPPAVTPGTTVGATAARIVATNLPQGVTQAMVDQGQDQFGTVCASCHGQGGVGSPAGPPLNDAQWLNVDGSFASLQQVINTGVPAPKQFPAPMPAKGGAALTDEQVRQVAAYVYSLSH